MPLLFFFKLIESEGTKLMFGLAGHMNNQYSTCFWMLIKSGKTEREAEEFLKVLIIEFCLCLCVSLSLYIIYFDRNIIFRFLCMHVCELVCIKSCFDFCLFYVFQLCRELKSKIKMNFFFSSLVSTTKIFLNHFVKDLVFSRQR